MKQAVYFIFLLCFCTLTAKHEEIVINNNNEKLEDVETHETQKTNHCNNPACPHCQNNNEPKPSDKEVQLVAISTLANIAQNLVNIGSDPHNTENVTSSVASILGSFANLVITAMKNKNINIEELLADEEFLKECATVLVKKVHKIKKQQQA